MGQRSRPKSLCDTSPLKHIDYALSLQQFGNLKSSFPSIIYTIPMSTHTKGQGRKTHFLCWGQHHGPGDTSPLQGVFWCTQDGEVSAHQSLQCTCKEMRAWKGWQTYLSYLDLPEIPTDILRRRYSRSQMPSEAESNGYHLHPQDECQINPSSHVNTESLP